MFIAIRNNERRSFNTKEEAIKFALKRDDLFSEIWDIIGDDGHFLIGFGG